VADTLSKDEVDALLKGMSDGDVVMDGDEASPGVATTISLTAAQDESPARRFPVLSIVHERFARGLEQTLGTIFESDPAVDRRELSTLDSSTLRNRLVPGSLMSLFSAAPLVGQGLLLLPPPLGCEMVDRLFGGPGRVPPELAERPLSPIALRTVEGIAAHMLTAFAGAWASLLRLETKLVRSESNPMLVTFDADAEFIVFETACDLGNGDASVLIALPRTGLEPLRAKMNENKPAPAHLDRTWLDALRSAVVQTDVLLTADLGRLDLSARDVLALRPGDVLHLPTRAEDALVVRVEGTPLLSGLAGVSRGRNAVRVLERDADVGVEG